MMTIGQIREKIRQVNPWLIVAGTLTILGLTGLLLCYMYKPDATVSRAAAQVTELADNIHKYYRNRPGYWGLDNQSALQSGMVPEAMVKNGKIINALGKEVLLGGDSSGGMVMPGARSFNIVYPDLSKKECWSLAVKGLTEKQMLGIISMTIDNGSGEEIFNWGGSNGLPIDSETAFKMCGGNNKLIWSYE